MNTYLFFMKDNIFTSQSSKKTPAKAGGANIILV